MARLKMSQVGEQVEMLATFAGSIALFILVLSLSNPPFHPVHRLRELGIKLRSGGQLYVLHGLFL